MTRGRMADTMEYSEVAFPKERFSEELLEELNIVAPSSFALKMTLSSLNTYISNAE